MDLEEIALGDFLYNLEFDSLFIPKNYLRFFAKRGFLSGSDLLNNDFEFEFQVDTFSLYRVIEYICKEYLPVDFTCIACYSQVTDNIGFESPCFTGLLLKPANKEASNQLNYADFVKSVIEQNQASLNEFGYI